MIKAPSAVPMNGDTKARRDAASMMMSMSHLMDAAAMHARQQGSPATPTEPLTVGNIQTEALSHHNHKSRGPHKKRTASNAALDDTHSSPRGGPSQSDHLINGGGVLRVPVTGSSAAVSSTGTASTTSSAGKGKAASASSSGSTTPNAPLTEEEKKAERRAANRRSAFQSRQRRKILIEDLQRTVAALSKDNNDLRKNNDELRTQLEATLLENRQLRQITSSLSAQAHLQQAQHQQSATGGQPTSTSSPSLSAKVPPSIPSISQPPSVAAAPSPFAAQSLANPTAALSSFLNSFSSQAAAPEQQQQILNAKIALMAAQSRVSELEHHQAAQAAASAAVAQQQLHAQAAVSALGLAHVPAATPGAVLGDAQHLARLQEFLTRGITGAPAATAPAPTVAPTSSSLSAAGVDLTHLRSLLEAQQQQQQQAIGAPGPIASASESSARPAAQEDTATKKTSASEAAPTQASKASKATSLAPTLNSTTAADAPGLQLLIESLRSGNATSGAPLDEAVRNYIKQQQLVQHQAHQSSNTATAIKTEAK